jgi:hypothetical protein
MSEQGKKIKPSRKLKALKKKLDGHALVTAGDVKGFQSEEILSLIFNRFTRVDTAITGLTKTVTGLTETVHKLLPSPAPDDKVFYTKFANALISASIEEYSHHQGSFYIVLPIPLSITESFVERCYIRNSWFLLADYFIKYIFLKDDKLPCHDLIILTGHPGLGKSVFIRFLVAVLIQMKDSTNVFYFIYFIFVSP